MRDNVPKGQPTNVQIKLAAVADLDDGATFEATALRYGVSVTSLKTWKAKWDEGESLENLPSRGRRDDEEPQEQDEDEDDAPDDAPEETPPMAKKARNQGLTTSTGAVLPPLPPQPKDAGRRFFPQDFKAALARALLAREVTVADVAKHYGIHDTVLRTWADAVSAGRIKGHRAAKKAAAAASAPVQNGRSTAIIPAPAAQMDLIPPPATLHAAPQNVYAELEYLRRENKRLRRKLEHALNMVLDDHDEGADDEHG